MPTADDWIVHQYADLRDMNVTSARGVGDFVHIEREGKPPVRYGIIKKLNVVAEDVKPLLDANADFIVSVKRDSIVHGDAIESCHSAGIPWGGLADSFRATRYSDPKEYMSSERKFVLGGLRRHSRVASVSFLDSRRLRVERVQELPALVLYIEPSYQAEVQTVHFAIDRCTPFDIFVATNPNAGPTTQATEFALSASVEILRWPETLRRLNI